jgi:hypothetical protein
MTRIKQLFLAGLAIAAVIAVSVASASAAPIGGTYEPSGPFNAILKVFPHNPDAAQDLFVRKAGKDPQEARAFIEFIGGGDSAVPTCPGGDIANCKLEDFLNEPI